MSVEVINHNSDLKRLQDEGYEIEIKQGYLIIHNVPYLDSELQLQMGIIVSPLNISGETVRYVNGGISHVVYFKGNFPYRSTGDKLNAVVNMQQNRTLAGINTNYMFSNKPAGGYKDYYHKMTNYIDILSNEAKALYPTATAKTFRRIISIDNDVLVYADTNASRAAISHINDKFRNQKIAVIGLGGTGSYILDQIAKVPVAEIHLFDGDVFCQHNAFRAPGAPHVSIFPEQHRKVEYFTTLYCNMHKNIVPHPYYVTEDNVDELIAMDYVFLAIDSGESKRCIVENLISNGIPFIDTGIDVQEVSDRLLGTTRVTEFNNGDIKTVYENISFVETEKGLYESNVQTAELNAFCAITAIIQWKRSKGFYLDNVNRKNCIFNTNDGEFK